MAKTIAVTGGAGFIGRACVRLIEEHGHTPIVLDRPTTDVRDIGTLAPIVKADAVIHLAGMLGTSELWGLAETAIDVNVRGTLNVLQACKLAGASYVGITLPDVWPNIYSATKAAAIRIALGFHHDDGLPVTHIRAFNAYGPGQAHGEGHPQKIIPTFATNILAGKPIPIWGDGQQTVDLVHVEHVARCLVGAAVLPGNGQTYDAGSGKERTVLEVADMVAAATGLRLEIEHLPMRKGEIAGTHLCATDPPPYCGFDQFDSDRFIRTIVAYWPSLV